ncbi:transposase [Anaerobiospirillum succiniciproducens]|uniref:transposase n=1 Tax=Anaerobiospirillum succiniciproducens TaxID=13335 RepID=UPI003899B1D1
MNPSVQLSKLINNMKTVTFETYAKGLWRIPKAIYWGTNAMWSRAYCLISIGDDPLSVLREYIENQDRLL